MKRMLVITALIIGAVVLGGAYVKNTFNFGTVSYERQTVEVEKVVEVDRLGKMIKDAQDAKAGEIEAAGEAAKQAAEVSMLEAIELEVRTAYRKELEAKEIELEKKSGF